MGPSASYLLVGESDPSNASADSCIVSGANVHHYHFYHGATPEILRMLHPNAKGTAIDYCRELLIRGVIEQDKNHGAQPSDWNKLQRHLAPDDGPKEIDSHYIWGARQILNFTREKGLHGILLSLLSNFGALHAKDGSMKVCLRKEWKTIPLPWRGGAAADLPTPCPDLTFGHGAGMDLIPARLHRVISPFFTPVLDEPSLMLPCATVQVTGDSDEHIRHTNQQAAAIMLRNMLELGLNNKPSRMLREMMSLENRISVLTVSVLQSSLVLTCHWLRRDPVVGHSEYYSRDMQTWDLDDPNQKQNGIECILRAITWVLNSNHSWVVGRLEQLMSHEGF